VFSIKQILKGGKVKRLDSQRPELRTSGRRILIVEDEVLISISAAQTLSDAGYHVVGVARTAVEPVEMAAAYRPDLVIMDIRLHDGPDGLAAAH
jgi:AmiR/NasT family two-component response regulator